MKCWELAQPLFIVPQSVLATEGALHLTVIPCQLSAPAKIADWKFPVLQRCHCR
jgi:hypothetical protein